jgi:hypothetical protein
MIPALLASAVAWAAERIALATGVAPRDRGLDLHRLAIPDTRLARDSEALLRATLSTELVAHSYRTWVFALAVGPSGEVDAEALYVSCLLHDIALEDPQPGRDFAVRGAETALALAGSLRTPPDRSRAIAEAICAHPTPGWSDHDGVLAAMVARGAALDLVRAGAGRLRPEFVASVLDRWPPTGFAPCIAAAWRAEARAVPDGRFALIERTVRMPSLVRLTHLRDC